MEAWYSLFGSTRHGSSCLSRIVIVIVTDRVLINKRLLEWSFSLFIEWIVQLGSWFLSWILYLGYLALHELSVDHFEWQVLVHENLLSRVSSLQHLLLTFFFAIKSHSYWFGFSLRKLHIGRSWQMGLVFSRNSFRRPYHINGTSYKIYKLFFSNLQLQGFIGSLFVQGLLFLASLHVLSWVWLFGCFLFFLLNASHFLISSQI